MKSLLLASLSVLVVPSVFAQAEFIPIDFGTGGVLQSYARGVDSTGSVVVGQAYTATTTFAFRWTASTGMVDLGVLPGGTSSADAIGVSGDGSWVCGSSNSPLGSEEAFLWSSTAGMQGLGILPTYVTSFAWDTTADGSTVVGDCYQLFGSSAFRWTSATGIVALPSLSGGGNNTARAISADGSTIVGATIGSSWVRAWSWTAGSGLVQLGALPGDNVSLAAAVTPDGSTIVGNSEDPFGFGQPVRWLSPGNPQSLGTYPGAFGTYAKGVSDDGLRVVGWASTNSGSIAFLWTNTGGLVDLPTYLIGNGATGVSGWTNLRAMDISGDGNVIVGSGVNPTGQLQGWIAVLDASTFYDIGTPFCDPMDLNCTGSPTQLTATIASGMGSDVNLFAAGGPSGEFGYFLIGAMENSPGISISNGRLCLGGQTGRYNVTGGVLNSLGQFDAAGDFVNLSGTGTSAGGFGFDVPASAPFGGMLAGSTWHFQLWHRDACGGPPASNFSNGLTVPVP